MDDSKWVAAGADNIDDNKTAAASDDLKLKRSAFVAPVVNCQDIALLA
jgi:hypothetical protein